MNDRRRFLKNAAVLAAAPLILPRRAWAAESAPSARLTLGCIGTGKRMNGLVKTFLRRPDVQVLAVCDVDTTRREYFRQLTDAAYSQADGSTYSACGAYNDFREVLARDDIDAVVIGTPDHWHAAMAAAAVRAGKDVYCEKPLTFDIHEAVALTEAVRRTDRVFQTGSQQRSAKEFRVAAELVRNGIIGRVHAINISVGGPPAPYDKPAEPLEPGLDWDLWCGPGPLVNYNPYLSPRGMHTHYPMWRGTWEFGGGGVTDWGAHHVDIAHWGLGVDGGGPVEVRAPENWATAERGAQLLYEGGTLLTHVRGRGVSFYGTEGEVHVNRGRFELVLDGKTVHRFWNKDLDTRTSLDRELALTEREFLKDASVRLEQSSDHFENFMEAVRNRRRPIADVATGASSVIACHLLNHAYHYGANARWDPVRHRYRKGGDNRWLRRDHYRNGWTV